MYKKKLTLGVAAAAAMLLPFGFVSPALAEELPPTVEAPAAETQAEQGSVEAPSEIEAPVEVVPEESVQGPTEGVEIKPVPQAGNDSELGRVAASTFKAARLSNPSAMSNPTSDTRTQSLVVAVDGPQNGYYSVSTAVGIEKKNAGVSSSNTYKPTLNWVKNPTPTSTGRVELRVPYYTTPGLYKLRVVVTHSTTGVKQSAVKYVTIKANSKYSKSRTGMSGSAYAGHTFPVSVTAPDYQTGAKVVVYYRPIGSSTYTAVNTGRLSAGTYNSKATVNISKNYNVAGRGGRIYVKIGSTSYAPSYQVSSAAVTPQ